MSVLMPTTAAGDLAVPERGTGELVALRDASDGALAEAAAKVAALDKELFAAKRALAAELRDRHGVGTARAGGYKFTIAESQSWPAKATEKALTALYRADKITAGDYERALPAKPTPDGRALKALLGRLVVSDPDAARVLADAATVSPPSLRDVKQDAIDHDDEVIW